jgi:hypothetical protein
MIGVGEGALGAVCRRLASWLLEAIGLMLNSNVGS